MYLENLVFDAVDPRRLGRFWEAADDRDGVLARVESLGARRLAHDWGDLPWTVCTDPGGNEFCLLPARSD